MILEVYCEENLKVFRSLKGNVQLYQNIWIIQTIQLYESVIQAWNTLF